MKTKAGQILLHQEIVNDDNDKKLAALDLVTPNLFDNNNFKNLIQKKVLHSNQLYSMRVYRFYCVRIQQKSYNI